MDLRKIFGKQKEPEPTNHLPFFKSIPNQQADEIQHYLTKQLEPYNEELKQCYERINALRNKKEQIVRERVEKNPQIFSLGTLCDYLWDDVETSRKHAMEIEIQNTKSVKELHKQKRKGFERECKHKKLIAYHPFVKAEFEIPEDIDLNAEYIERWFVRAAELSIYFKDGRPKIVIKPFQSPATSGNRLWVDDYAYPDKVCIVDDEDRAGR